MNTFSPTFRIGRVIKSTLVITFKNIVPFGLLTLILQLPGFLFALGAPADPTAPQFSWGGIAIYLLQFLFTILLGALVVYGTVQEMRGQHASFGETIGRGLASLLPAVGVALLVYVILVVGFLLVIVPGLVAAVMLWVAIPVAVLERPGVFASMRRSAELTRGSRWKIFALLVIYSVVTIINTSTLGFFFGMELLSGESTMAFNVLNYLTGAFLLLVGSVLGAVSYYELRNAREGIDVADIVTVFD